MTIRQRLCAWLFPDIHRESQQYLRLRGKLDEARWWLSASHPEAAALAEHLLREDAHYNGLDVTFPENSWSPPKTVWTIDAFRSWLYTKPFAGKQ